MDWETKDAYAWVLQCMLDTTGLMPKMFITDADPGMDAAIQLKYSSYICNLLYLAYKSKFTITSQIKTW